MPITTTKTYHPNGQVKILSRHKDGKRHGTWKEWFSNGKLKLVTHYLDDKQCGQCVEWHDNRSHQLKVRCRYEQDLPLGLWEEWDKWGKCLFSKTFTHKDYQTPQSL